MLAAPGSERRASNYLMMADNAVCTSIHLGEAICLLAPKLFMGSS